MTVSCGGVNLLVWETYFYHPLHAGAKKLNKKVRFEFSENFLFKIAYESRR